MVGMILTGKHRNTGGKKLVAQQVDVPNSKLKTFSLNFFQAT